MSVRPIRSPALTPLVIRFGRLGDTVLQAPLLHLLRRRFGRPCRLLGAGPWSTALYGADENVAEVWQLRSRHTPFLLSPARWRLVGALRRHDGPVYVSEDIDKQVARIRQLLALAGIAPARCLFLTDRPATAEHWVDRLVDFGRLTPEALCADVYPHAECEAPSAPRLRLHSCDRSECDRWLRARGWSGQPIVLLQPGNKHALKHGRPRRGDRKAWPVGNWAALLRAMRRMLPAARLLLCGSPAEARWLEDLRAVAGVANVAVAAEDFPLRCLMALLEIAHSMVAVDTGPAHMAAAVGCPLLVLYGAESPRVWGRRSPCGKPVVEIGGPPAIAAVRDIAVGDVIAAWSEMAGAQRRAPALA